MVTSLRLESSDGLMICFPDSEILKFWCLATGLSSPVKEFEDYLLSRNIAHVKISVYNPAENGLVEVFNRKLKYGAQTIHSEGKNFHRGLNEILTSFRSTPSTPGGKSPAELLFGWNMKMDLEIKNRPVYVEAALGLEMHLKS